MSVGKCVKLVQMLGLHRLDSNDERDIILPHARDWTEMEEWRRTFWASYFADRWASTMSRRPLSFRDADVRNQPTKPLFE
jgi:hypothetical protein